MRYEGYHTDSALPVLKGDTVVIPAGTTVRSMGSRGTYVTKRKQTVVVHRVGNGQSVSVATALGDRHVRRVLEERGYDFAALEKLRETNSVEYYRGMVPIQNPDVVWAGTGGYFCHVDINDVLGGAQ